MFAIPSVWVPTPNVFWIIPLDSNYGTKGIGTVIEKSDPIKTFRGALSVFTHIAKSAQRDLIPIIGGRVNPVRKIVKEL